MIGDLLDLSVIESGHLALKLQNSDLREIVRTVSELFKAGSAIHEMELALPDGPCPMHCDAARLEQVLTNLVSNAIKYSPHGGAVRIALEVRAS